MKRCASGAEVPHPACHPVHSRTPSGRRGVDRPDGPQHGAVVLRAAERLAPGPCPKQHRVGRAARAQPSRIAEAHDVGRCPRHHRRPVAARTVEVGDLHRLGEHLQHVETAVSVERIARLVVRQSDRRGDGGSSVRDDRGTGRAWQGRVDTGRLRRNAMTSNHVPSRSGSGSV